MIITTKASAITISMILTTTGSSSLFSSDLGHYLTAVGMIAAGLVVAISYIRKEASAQQKPHDGIEALQIGLAKLLETCAERGEKSHKLGERVAKIEGAK